MSRKNLNHVLDEQFAELLVCQAETIRSWPNATERFEQAEIHVRTALLEQIRGRITQETQCRVYSILSFVIPADGAFEGDPQPLAELEREADWERAYHEQLQRRFCEDCGEGICRAEES
jgi:hypothetical protein